MGLRAIPGGLVTGTKLGFFRRIWIWFLILLVALTLLNAIVLVVVEKDIKPGVRYLGEKLLTPTLHLGEESQEIIDNVGPIIRSEDGTFSTIWNTITTYSSLLSSLVSIGLWIYVLTWIYAHSLFSNKSNAGINGSLATLTFFIAQMLFLSMDGRDIMIPFRCFVQFIQAIIIMFVRTKFDWKVPSISEIF